MGLQTLVLAASCAAPRNRGRAGRARQRLGAILDVDMRVTAPREIKDPEDLRFLSPAHLADADLEIDLADVEWISPLGVVAVLAACLRADNEALDAAVFLPEDKGARTYLAATGLLDELEVHGWTLASGGLVDERIAKVGRPGWSEHGDIDIEAFAGASALPQGGRPLQASIEDIDIDPDLTFSPYLPVSRLSTMREVDLAADQLEDAMRRSPHLRGGLFDELLTIAVELTANAREHGSDCYAVAQAHSGKTSGTPGVRIAVADFGVGLAGTLREHYGPMSDGKAIVHAFTERVSGTGRSERGFGLTQIREIVDRDPKSVLHIVSQSGHVVRTDRQFEVTESEELLFNGTLATAYLPSPSPIIRMSGGDR